jgi:hypothetical protein
VKKLLVFVATVVVLLAAVFSGVAPIGSNVESLQIGSTLWGMQQAIAGKAGTTMLMKDSAILFVWNVQDGMAFAAINGASREPIKEFVQIAKQGNLVNVKTMNDLCQFLSINGWKAVTAAEVPATVKAALATGAFAQMAQSMVTFVVIPEGLEVPYGYQKVTQ